MLKVSMMVVLVAGMIAIGAAPGEAQQADRDATALLERADTLLRQHRMHDALALYERAVRVHDQANELPVLALRRIAVIHLVANRPMRAADAMDRLAQRAEWLGYPDVQASALMEAAALHYQQGSRAGARERVERLQPLLGSPHLTTETAAGIRSRLRVRTAAR